VFLLEKSEDEVVFRVFGLQAAVGLHARFPSRNGRLSAKRAPRRNATAPDAELERDRALYMLV
jgi:hypothetical protein